MSRRDWWFGILAVSAAILLHAALPRYEWRQGPSPLTLVRIDRWTGWAHLGRFDGTWWKPLEQIEAAHRVQVPLSTLDPR